MKIRVGFVSNSSSCSFCIAKCYMTPEAIAELQRISQKSADVNGMPYSERTEEEHRYYSEEGCINETDLYFFGTVSMHFAALEEFGARKDIKKFISWGD